MIIILAFFFFLCGLFGIIVRQKNFLSILLCLELLIIGVMIIFIFVSVTFYDGRGYLFVLLLMVISTVGTAIGLSLLLIGYKKKNNLIVSNFKYFRY
jgi:NADH:ubiquinone oxidoreductase subunit K